MLTETDRAEITALVEEALAARGREAVAARSTTPTRRPVRLGRAEAPAGEERLAFSPSDGLAELERSLAELRGELAERLNYETQQREELTRQIRQMLEQARGSQNGGGQTQVQGVGPVGQEGQAGNPGPNAGSMAAPGGSKPGGASTARSQWADPAQASAPGRAPSGAGAGGADAQGASYQGAAQKLAQANFDLAEALNENLRNLKEIVDRSQELVARIENILRRQAKGRQGE